MQRMQQSIASHPWHEDFSFASNIPSSNTLRRLSTLSMIILHNYNWFLLLNLGRIYLIYRMFRENNIHQLIMITHWDVREEQFLEIRQDGSRVCLC